MQRRGGSSSRRLRAAQAAAAAALGGEERRRWWGINRRGAPVAWGRGKPAGACGARTPAAAAPVREEDDAGGSACGSAGLRPGRASRGFF